MSELSFLGLGLELGDVVWEAGILLVDRMG